MTKKNFPQKGVKEKRNFAIADLRALADGNTIEGHAAVYDQVADINGWFKEVIERGAFDNTDFKDVVFSVNHDLDKIPLARSRNNNANSTLQLQVDNVGLAVKANLDVANNSEAKSLYSSVSRGDMNGMSFIFWVEDEEWEGLDTDMPTRRIKSVAKVREVSAVSFPAYSGTNINARDTQALDSAKQALDNARAKAEELDNSNAELDSSNVVIEQHREQTNNNNSDEEKRQQEEFEFEKLKYEMLMDLK